MVPLSRADGPVRARDADTNKLTISYQFQTNIRHTRCQQFLRVHPPVEGLENYAAHVTVIKMPPQSQHLIKTF